MPPGKGGGVQGRTKVRTTLQEEKDLHLRCPHYIVDEGKEEDPNFSEGEKKTEKVVTCIIVKLGEIQGGKKYNQEGKKISSAWKGEQNRTKTGTENSGGGFREGAVISDAKVRTC